MELVLYIFNEFVLGAFSVGSSCSFSFCLFNSVSKIYCSRWELYSISVWNLPFCSC